MRFQCSVLKVQIVIFRNGPVAQLVRASPCHGEGREFESLLGRYVGSQLSWESICLTSRGSQVRALQVPYMKRIWRDSSVGQSTRFIPVVSGVRVSLSLLHGHLEQRCLFLHIQGEYRKTLPKRKYFHLYNSQNNGILLRENKMIAVRKENENARWNGV